MYEVGTIIYIIYAGRGALGCNNKFGIVTHKRSESGLFDDDEGFNIKLDHNNTIWRVNNDGQYAACPYQNKEEIEDWKNSLRMMFEMTR